MVFQICVDTSDEFSLALSSFARLYVSQGSEEAKFSIELDSVVFDPICGIELCHAEKSRLRPSLE